MTLSVFLSLELMESSETRAGALFRLCNIFLVKIVDVAAFFGKLVRNTSKLLDVAVKWVSVK